MRYHCPDAPTHVNPSDMHSTRDRLRSLSGLENQLDQHPRLQQSHHQSFGGHRLKDRSSEQGHATACSSIPCTQLERRTPHRPDHRPRSFRCASADIPTNTTSKALGRQCGQCGQLGHRLRHHRHDPRDADLLRGRLGEAPTWQEPTTVTPSVKATATGRSTTGSAPPAQDLISNSV